MSRADVRGSWRPGWLGMARVLSSWLPPAGPAAPVFTDSEGTLTRGDLVRLVLARRRSLPPGRRLIVCSARQRDVLVDLLAGTLARREVVVLSPRAGDEARRAAEAAPPGRRGVRLCTSGTSGPPKPIHTHRNPAVLWQLASVFGRLPPARRPVIACLAPLDHGHGFSLFAAALAMGGHFVALDADAAPGQLARLGRVDVLSGVPVQLAELCDAPPRGGGARVGIVLSGSDRLSAAVAERLERRFGPVWNAYGSTETGTVCLASPEDRRRGPDAVGRPLAGVRIRSRADGRLVITSPMLSGPPFDADTGWIDEAGHVHVSGRADGLLVTGGETVRPDRLTAWLSAQPGVAAASVGDVPDPRFGRRLSATIVPVPGAAVDADNLRAGAREALGPALTPVLVTVAEPRRS